MGQKVASKVEKYIKSEEIEHFLYIWKLKLLKLFRSFSLRVLKYTHCKYQ